MNSEPVNPTAPPYYRGSEGITTDRLPPTHAQRPPNESVKRDLAKLIHETRIAYCWPNGMQHNQPWPDKLPGDFGYIPQPWVDIAFAQAKAIMDGFDVTAR